MQWRLILFLSLMVLVVVFSIANADPVDFNYLFGEGSLSLALVIIISALVGAIGGVVSNVSTQARLKHALYEKEQELRAINRDNTELSDELGARREQRGKRRKEE